MAAPVQLLHRLTELARYERRLRLLWGVARWLAAMATALALCCLLDWIIDRSTNTPAWVRVGMRVALVSLGIALAYRWILRPARTGLSHVDLALWIEGRDPRHEHRLISAVQLNASTADRAGMSTVMIDAVTVQAETAAQATKFTELVTDRRFSSSWYLLGVLAAIVLLMAWIMPFTLSALIQRQWGRDMRIPRSVRVAPRSETLWPSGEPVMLKFLVTSQDRDVSSAAQLAGSVQIQPDGQTPESYELTYLQPGPSQASAIYSATIPASSIPFTYRAWLGDGRTYETSQVTFSPRPVLTAWDAWLRLPAYLGHKPDGQAYEFVQPKGDLRPIPGSSARLRVVTQLPVVSATAELLAPLSPTLGSQVVPSCGPVSIQFLLDAQYLVGWTPTSAGPLFPIQRAALQLSPEKTAGSAVVPLPAYASAYRVIVQDEHGFTNRPIPRRAITFKPDEQPQVTLLPEQFGDPSAGPEDVDLEGMPLPLGRPLRIAYRVHDDFSLESARLKYRINDGPWQSFTLTEVMAPKPQAEFDLTRGAFASSAPKDQIQFHAVAGGSGNDARARSQGGGRFDFQTRAIPALKLGDVLEYYVEVQDKHVDPQRVPGRSAVRRKTIVTQAQFVEWVVQTLQQENRLRQLERQQRRVFEPSGGS